MKTEHSIKFNCPKVDDFFLKINHALFQIFIATNGSPITHTFIWQKTRQTNARFVIRIINWRDIKFDFFFFGGEGSHNKPGFSSGFTVQTALEYSIIDSFSSLSFGTSSFFHKSLYEVEGLS